MSVRDQLLGLERGFWDAGGDGDFYRSNMDDDGRCLLPFGAMDKSATVEAIGQGPPWDSHHFDQVDVHRLAEDAAVLTYRATGRRDGEDPYRALITSCYRRQGEDWKLLIHQQTPLADEQ